MKIAAIIIAGGKARRFNSADKALVRFNGKALIDHAVECLSGQLDDIAINRSASLTGYSLPIVPDLDSDFPGPIGGLEAAIVWAKSLKVKPDYLLTIPVDTPHLPSDLVAKLLPAAKESGAAIASVKNKPQPTISLHKVGHIKDSDLAAFKNKALRDFWQHIGAQPVNFDDENAFININSPADVEKYQDNQ